MARECSVSISNVNSIRIRNTMDEGKLEAFVHILRENKNIFNIINYVNIVK